MKLELSLNIYHRNARDGCPSRLIWRSPTQTNPSDQFVFGLLNDVYKLGLFDSVFCLNEMDLQGNWVGGCELNSYG
jgi:hypothetical protein